MQVQKIHLCLELQAAWKWMIDQKFNRYIDTTNGGLEEINFF